MAEIGSELQRKRDKLSRRLRKYFLYLILESLAIFGGYFVGVFLFFTQVKRSDDVVRQLVVLSPMVAGILLNQILTHFEKTSRLTVEQRVFLKVCSAVDDLSEYLEDGREPDRKRAEKKIQGISDEIEKWNFGRLQLSKKTLGPHFEPFKEAFYRKVAGAVKQREKKDLMSACQFLKDFLKYLSSDDPKIDDVDRMTKAMNEEISVTLFPRAATKRRIFRSLKEANLTRHIKAVGLIFAAGLIPALLGTYIWHASIETALIVFATIFGPLIAVYLSDVLKKGRTD